MIDIHCHILPGLDDGAKTMEETLEMLHIAKEKGITDIVATPHIYPEFYFPEMEKIFQIFGEVKEKVDGINLYLGTDIHFCPETLKYLREGRALTINNGNYVLIEPPEFFSEGELLQMLFQIRGEGYRPVITHPERYQIFREKKTLLFKIVEQGNFLQLTSASITGYFGETVQNFSKELIKEKIVHIIASDAHSPRRRIPFLKDAYDKVSEWAGESYSLYLQDNARRVLKNEELLEFERASIKKSFLKKFLEKIW
ncbi:MAG: CpsB/CapC family capsule biosynthesis tyrosine phosphatase [Thermoanaerobaculia bacterium]